MSWHCTPHPQIQIDSTQRTANTVCRRRRCTKASNAGRERGAHPALEVPLLDCGGRQPDDVLAALRGLQVGPPHGGQIGRPEGAPQFEVVFRPLLHHQGVQVVHQLLAHLGHRFCFTWKSGVDLVLGVKEGGVAAIDL